MDLAVHRQLAPVMTHLVAHGQAGDVLIGALVLGVGPLWDDVDNRADLIALTQRLRENPNAAPATSVFLVDLQSLVEGFECGVVGNVDVERRH